MDWLKKMSNQHDNRNRLRVAQKAVPIQQKDAQPNSRVFSNLKIPSLTNTDVNRFYEGAPLLQAVYDSLPVRECLREFPEYPAIHGASALYVGLKSGRFVKAVKADVIGVNELVRSLQMASVGVGPAVLDAYLCVRGTQLHMEFERLEGTLSQYLAEHRNEVQMCIAALEMVNRVLQVARAQGFTSLDFKHDNVMYKFHPDGTLQWYLIDFGDSLRLASGSKQHHVSVNWNLRQYRDRL